MLTKKIEPYPDYWINPNQGSYYGSGQMNSLRETIMQRRREASNAFLDRISSQDDWDSYLGDHPWMRPGIYVRYRTVVPTNAYGIHYVAQMKRNVSEFPTDTHKGWPRAFRLINMNFTRDESTQKINPMWERWDSLTDFCVCPDNEREVFVSDYLQDCVEQWCVQERLQPPERFEWKPIPTPAADNTPPV